MYTGPEIKIAKDVSEELVKAFAQLVPQLSRAKPPDARVLLEIIRSPTSAILVARIEGRIVGALTLSVFRTPTAVRGWIDDVVVDERARGQGVGESLTREALQIAIGRGAEFVSLTSRPSRTVAHELYKKIGFEKRESTVFRYDLCS